MSVVPNISGQSVALRNYEFKRAVQAPLFVPRYGVAVGTPFANDVEGRIYYNVLAGSQRWQMGENGKTYSESWHIRAQDIPYLEGLLPQVEHVTDGKPDAPISFFPYPGNPSLICKSIAVEGHGRGKPLDPHEFDGDRLIAPAQWLERYEHSAIATLTFEYDPELVELNDQSPDESLPLALGLRQRSLVRLESRLGGEFIVVGQQNTGFLAVDAITGGLYTEIGVPPEAPSADQNNVANWTYVTGETPLVIVNTQFDAPLSTVIAHAEHKLIWKNVWRVPWGNLKRCLGKVNNAILPWLNNAARETVLFTGAEVQEQLQRSVVGAKLYTVTLNFSERHIRVPFAEGALRDGGGFSAILGWNHVYRPGNTPAQGQWARVLVKYVAEDVSEIMQSQVPLYTEEDFGLLFRADMPGSRPAQLDLQVGDFGDFAVLSAVPIRPAAYGYRSVPAVIAPPPAMIVG